ncbi:MULTISPECIES: hypothetical protein [Streptomyces]|uniref:Cobyrinic acid a,c-diamide synthase n=1 Tax=Streptomyces lycii TaxID=2654337 RepID=A0ABQ7FK92_9ACTN|nr:MULTISPECIES: hypothetical protein [Streptomyces]KAF4409260.1 hypothetical protein GCU69_09900 [Streptomyces lycii]PGH51093.1 hypothetical protein CRI70_08495 [Streptomyces sp. Ru87]
MSLPGADELFRTTGGTALQASTPPAANGEARVPAPASSTEDDKPRAADASGAAEHGGREESPDRPASRPAKQQAAAPARRRGRGANRRPSGRERHDEKITVYVSAEELMDLEHARLVLRGEHGLAVDRGRIVREAVAVVLADLESRGDASILVRRLRGH